MIVSLGKTKKVFLFILLFLICFTGLSQEIIRLEGQVLNDTIEKASLTVVNISLRKGTITNEAGRFVIEAREQDTINISAVQFESRQFVVSKTIFNRKKISLYLIPKVNQLDEVNISNIDLTGDIVKDALSTKMKPYISASSLGLPENTRAPMTVEERRLYTATSSSGGIIPIGALINAISGRTKMLKKHVEVSRLQAMVQRNRQKFSDSLYMQELKIPEELIEDFVYYVFEDNQAIKKVNHNNLLELLEFMATKSQTYLDLKKEEGYLLPVIKD